MVFKSAIFAISLISAVFHIAVGVLLFIRSLVDNEPRNFFPMKSVLQQPIAYFKVDNSSNPIENNHNFFRWEGMYTVENP